jgi:hypothetical protein
MEALMFSFLKPTKINLNVQLDPDALVYIPGQTIRARFSVENDREVKIQGLRFAVFYNEYYEYREEVSEIDDDGGTSRSVKTSNRSNETEVFRFDPLLESNLAPGRLDYETAFTLGRDALPSCEGKIAALNWYAKATLDRKLAADINTRVGFRVLSLVPEVLTPPGQYGVSNQPGEAQLCFDLPNKEVINNTALMGSLRVAPVKSFEVKEIRLELVCREFVPDVTRTGNTNTRETVAAKMPIAGKFTLQPGQPVEIPFIFQLPAQIPPTASLNVGKISYTLKGILARSLRGDTFVEEEIRVFTGSVG